MSRTSNWIQIKACWICPYRKELEIEKLHVCTCRPHEKCQCKTGTERRDHCFHPSVIEVNDYNAKIFKTHDGVGLHADSGDIGSVGVPTWCPLPEGELIVR